MNMNITVTLNHEDLVNLLSAASSGISYWCDCLDYDDKDCAKAKATCEELYGEDFCREDIWAQILLKGKPLMIFVDEEEDGENLSEYDLTYDHLCTAVSEVIKQGIWDGQDWGDVDAEVGDAIVQYALFDEIVFG